MKRILTGLLLVGGITAVLLQAAVWGQRAAQAATEPSRMTTASAAADVCTGDNLLANPSFEGDFTPYVMAPPGHPDCQTWHPDQPNQYCERVKLPPDWHPWWRSSPRTENWMNIQPEYVPSLPHEQPPRVRSGEKSQHYFSFWSTHEGGLYQQITAVPNGTYCFQAWGHAWSSRTTLSGYLSDPNDHGSLFQRVGIDPTGGTDWQSPNIIWSDERMQYDEFGLFTVEAVAQAETITVFLASRAEVPVKHNDVYWDDAKVTLDKLLAVTPRDLVMMADVDAPAMLTRTVSIDVTPALEWTAVLSTTGTLTPTLSATSGSDSATIDLIVDSDGLSPGTYGTILTISAGDGVAGSPTTVPVTLYVVEEIERAFLPLINQ